MSTPASPSAPSQPPTRPCDSLGNPVTLHDPASLGPVNDFVEGFIRCEARCVRLLDAAQDSSPLVQAYAAALHLFAENAQAARHARPFIERAQAQASGATEREQRFIAAVAAWVDGDLARAVALHEEQARQHPRDLVSLKLGQYHLFNQGDSPGMLRLALACAAAAADVPQWHGMAAFGYEQCHLLTEAEHAARQALSDCPSEPWAQHALAHVMLTQGRHVEGRDFLRAAHGGWGVLNSFMRTHNWWHLALFELELGAHEAVLTLYDQQVWGVEKSYSQDQINAVSLLARLELAGVDVGPRWQDLGHHLSQREHDHVLPFLDLQYLYGLARAGRPAQAHAWLDSLQAHAEQVRGPLKNAWRDVAWPAAQGLLAHAQGDHAEAAQRLGTALPRLLETGGSHAQRDLFSQIHLDALMRSGQWVGAQNLLQPQANQQAQSQRLQRQARAVRAALGLPVD
ncbi:tetratricopeptide repeat protein [Curvibacter sp. HBC28]|uniref:Tetratricopeptide repeat protein 38 n=1 Tax=Curvibacter microcysteis TaxID=3026419 RepID=A0ABT5MIG4_9BURK|nr:tetratricopeptide repeat protein [Curvibacter sp. HBC28]MDD0816378.1 tetratricopeptide repeat protein [Curvibacter sp. HBC28]